MKTTASTTTPAAISMTCSCNSTTPTTVSPVITSDPTEARLVSFTTTMNTGTSTRARYGKSGWRA